MKDGHTFVLSVVLLFGNAIASSDAQTSASGVRLADSEREVQEFVFRVAKVDLDDLQKIDDLGRGDWQLAPSSRERSVGWITHQAKVVQAPPWLETAYLLTYAGTDAQGEASATLPGSRLTVSLRDNVCFSGAAIAEKHLRGTVSDQIAAQVRDGAGYVALLSIAGRDVDLRYRADNDCVSQVTFYGRPRKHLRR